MASAKQEFIPAATRLRQLIHSSPGILVCPGVYDGLSARIALNAGFDALYMTGAGTTISRLGQPDLGIATLNDMRDHAGMIASLDRNVPLIADADTGYGGPIMVGRTVAQYMAAGVAGLHLEDQVQTKRCGHLMGKELVSEEIFISRIKAAVFARQQTPGDIVIIARTDALQSYAYDDALKRLKAAIAAGADVAFLEGITSKEQGRLACQELAPTPVLLNMVGGGVTPDLSVAEAEEIGFKIIIFPGVALGPAFKAIGEAMHSLKETGVPQKADRSLKELFNIVGLAEHVAFDKAAGGSAFTNGV